MAKRNGLLWLISNRPVTIDGIAWDQKKYHLVFGHLWSSGDKGLQEKAENAVANRVTNRAVDRIL